MKCPRCNGTGEVPGLATGEAIRAFREKLGMTQLELSEVVGRSRAQIANIESGRSDLPISMLARFAKALGCSMKDLVL